VPPWGRLLWFRSTVSAAITPRHLVGLTDRERDEHRSVQVASCLICLTGVERDGNEGAQDDSLDLLVAAEEELGATIMGRNMFGPIRGSGGSDPWSGWWGDDPPFHHPVFVLTHHRWSIAMRGGAAFHFVDDGIEGALERALEAADGNDVRVGGGAATIQRYLPAGLIDDMHLAIVPVRLGGGERLFDHVDGGPDGYECVEFVSSPTVTHARLSPTTR